MKESDRMRCLHACFVALAALTLLSATVIAAPQAAHAAAANPAYTQTCPAGYDPIGGTVLQPSYTFTYFVNNHPVYATVSGQGWEYGCANPTTHGSYLTHYYYAYASVTVSDSSLTGTGAVWIYNARTGSYLASTPTYPVGGGNGLMQGSGATNTVYSADGIKMRLGFRQTGGNYIQTGLYGPSDPLYYRFQR
jgi:hypothetical protein